MRGARRGGEFHTNLNLVLDRVALNLRSCQKFLNINNSDRSIFQSVTRAFSEKVGFSFLSTLSVVTG